MCEITTLTLDRGLDNTVASSAIMAENAEGSVTNQLRRSSLTVCNREYGQNTIQGFPGFKGDS
jgi:hypothetical protein